jgi:Uma2 family endonuclease
MSTILFRALATPAVEIPAGVESIAHFRQWARSDRFPESGRIDFVDGAIEVDMSPEDLFNHNFPKTELTAVLHQWVKQHRLGWVFSDRSRVSCAKVGLSVEPDVAFVSQASVDRGRVKFRAAKSAAASGMVEIVGPPDVVVEFVSDSSVRKDTEVLPERYYAAGIREYWLVDGRGRSLRFDIYIRGESQFVAVVPSADGYRVSTTMGAALRLTRKRIRKPMWDYSLEIRPVE